MSAIEPGPHAEITKGNPTDEEMAAIVAVLAVAFQPPAPPRKNLDRGVAGGWKSYWRVVRQPLIPGRETWQGSLRR